jgi:hypothetical protein
MTMIFKITVLATALSTFTTLAAAGQLNTPNEFQAGTPALASEVNANFDAVESAVNDNDMRISSLEGRLIHNKTIVLQDGLAKSRTGKASHPPEPSVAWCGGDPGCEAYTGGVQAV